MRKDLGVVALMLSSFVTSNSWAVLMENLAIGSPKALGLANAVTASPPGIESIHFNPAGLSRVEGRQQSINVVYGDFGITLDFGKRTKTRQALLDQAESLGHDLDVEFPDGFFDDEAYMASSETSGMTIMLPGLGMTDLVAPMSLVGGVSVSPPGGSITFGTAAYTTMAAGFRREDDDPGRFIGQRFSMIDLVYFSPTVAVDVTDTLSVAATITFNYGGVGLDMPLRVPHLAQMAIPFLQLSNCDLSNPGGVGCENLPLYEQLGELSVEAEDGLAFGFNFGMLWEATPWLTFGVVYQSEVDLEMEGEFSWENSDQWVAFVRSLREDPLIRLAMDVVGVRGEKRVEGDVTIALTMPEHLALGVSVLLTPKLRVNVDYKFTGWSAWDELVIELSKTTDLMAIASIGEFSAGEGVSLKIPLGMQDTWNLAVGLEYQYNDQWVLRMGVEDRPTSIPENMKTPLLPLGDGLLLGFGFGYQSDSGAVYDVGLSYFESKISMPGNTSDFGNSEDPTKLIYNPYPGQDIDATTTIVMFEMGVQRPF